MRRRRPPGTRETPRAVERSVRTTALKTTANLADGTTRADARKEITDSRHALALPPGYRWSFGQGFDRDDQAGQQMLFNTLIALVLVYVVMCAMFESLLFPAAILGTFIYAIFGVFWLFWLSGTTFSIMAAIGVLILMGVVVNNGIVLLELGQHWQLIVSGLVLLTAVVVVEVRAKRRAR